MVNSGSFIFSIVNAPVSTCEITSFPQTLIVIYFALMTPPVVIGDKYIVSLVIGDEISTLRVVPDILNGGELVEPEEQESLKHN